MIVVDTNVIAYLHIESDRSSQAEALLLQDSQWAAPALWLSEFRNVLSLYLRKELLTYDEILTILERAELLFSGRRYAVSSPAVMKLIHSSNCSAYDCEFVALAQHLNVALVTVDKKILREFPGTAVSLESFVAA